MNTTIEPNDTTIVYSYMNKCKIDVNIVCFINGGRLQHWSQP